MGYFKKYDTHFDDETGKWTEEIGFCPKGTCEYCDAYIADGSPSSAFEIIRKK